jgi:hypothetical protein
MWHLSCSFQGQRVSFSLLREDIGDEERRLKMIKLLRQFLVIAMLGMVSAGAFAQGKGGDKRPPKEPAKVVTNDRKDKPPPRNTNQQPPKGNKRGRP